MKNKNNLKNKKQSKKNQRGFMFPFFLFLIAFAQPIMAHSGEDYYGHHSMMGGYWGMNGMWVFGWIFGLLIIVALVLFIVLMIEKIQKEK
jgi:uncharacterized membrane protein